MGYVVCCMWVMPNRLWGIEYGVWGMGFGVCGMGMGYEVLGMRYGVKLIKIFIYSLTTPSQTVVIPSYRS